MPTLLEITKRIKDFEAVNLNEFYELIAVLNEKGIYLNNLFQRGNGYWQGKFQSDKNIYDYGIASTLGEAMSIAITNLSNPERRNVESPAKGYSKAVEDFFK